MPAQQQGAQRLQQLVHHQWQIGKRKQLYI
jgi:hypothetical protein